MSRHIVLTEEPAFDLGGVRIDPALRSLDWSGGRLRIEPRVMQVLVLLNRHLGRVVPRDTVIAACWESRIVGDDAVNRCLQKLRRAGEASGGFAVETVPRAGFRLLETKPGAAVVSSGRFGRPHLLGLGLLGGTLLLAVILAVTLLGHGAPPSRAAPVSTATVFSDCPECPRMVTIPAGDLKVTASTRDPWGQTRLVTLKRSFAISQFDVTRDEYAASTYNDDPTHQNCYTFNRAGDLKESRGTWRNPGFAQTGRDPVVCVSWGDAQAYAAWLSARTGKHYRLPTEAEWAYAAQSGSEHVPRTAIDCHLNGADINYHKEFPDDPAVETRCNDGFVYTSPVGSFAPSARGMFDVLGNAWQILRDCYDDDLNSAFPRDGSAFEKPNCELHVVRGGSWADDPKKIRLDRRELVRGEGRFSTNSFRVVRDLP